MSVELCFEVFAYNTTKEEYHEICEKAIRLLSSSAVQVDGLVDHYADEHIYPNLPEHGASIGTFTNAHHHRDGLFSEVFVAKSPASTDLVALKVTTPSMMVPPHNSIREARILKDLGGSNHVIELLTSFHDSHNRFVLVFPFLRLELSTLLQREMLPLPIQKSILHDLLCALQYLHSNDIIHRDIKPGNILIASPSGPAYLADFGIAWSVKDKDSEPAAEKILEVGTTCYRSPELLFGNQGYTSAVDIWATGCVAAQIVCLGRNTIFDAGDLGSELALIKSIFQTLGTPDLETWPEAQECPDWGKMNFIKYPAQTWEAILKDCSMSARSFVSSMIRYGSSSRESADQMLKHPFLCS